jgi:F0F1-type ATP synthase membrane subunit b/b'
MTTALQVTLLVAALLAFGGLLYAAFKPWGDALDRREAQIAERAEWESRRGFPL